MYFWSVHLLSCSGIIDPFTTTVIKSIIVFGDRYCGDCFSSNLLLNILKFSIKNSSN